MKKLIIQRLDTANYFRNVTVFIDGKKMGRVSFAEVAQFEIPADSKRLSVKLDWCQSKNIQLNPELSEEAFFVECSSSFTNLFIHTSEYLRLHNVKKKDLPSREELEEFRKNFIKVAGISTLMIVLFGVFFIYTLYVAIFENSPLWYALSALAGYNIFRISKGIRERMKGQM